MMSKQNWKLNMKNFCLPDVFDPKAIVNFREFTLDQYKAHRNYCELCITLALKNRIGLLNITKNLTYE